MPTENPALHLEPADIAAILVADPSWQPIRYGPGHLVDGSTGEYTHPGNPYAIEGPPIPMLPPHWRWSNPSPTVVTALRPATGF